MEPSAQTETIKRHNWRRGYIDNNPRVSNTAKTFSFSISVCHLLQTPDWGLWDIMLYVLFPSRIRLTFISWIFIDFTITRQQYFLVSRQQYFFYELIATRVYFWICHWTYWDGNFIMKTLIWWVENPEYTSWNLSRRNFIPMEFSLIWTGTVFQSVEREPMDQHAIRNHKYLCKNLRLFLKCFKLYAVSDCTLWWLCVLVVTRIVICCIHILNHPALGCGHLDFRF